ncbi:MAG: TonB-dependent receptor [Deltaproteobacteria bacterium]|nr:TonB-dependent receptor [Deltaproteobacteria bacterium]
MLSRIFRVAVVALFIFSSLSSADEPRTGSVEIYLVDKVSGDPVIGSPLKLDERDPVHIADEQGRFNKHGLAPGEHILEVFDPEHQPFKTSFSINAGQTTRLHYALDRLGVQEEEEVIIRAERLEQEVSDTVLEIDEVRKIPGTQGDIIKIVQSLPGVARGLAFGGSAGPGIVVRGAAPEDSQVLIDGHEIPLLYHFGGLKSVLNSDMLKRIDFLPGGFGAEYGEAIGGIVDVSTRPCSKKQYDGYLELSMLDAGFFIEGPIGDEVGFIAAARRSTVDIWLPEVIPEDSGFELTVAPVYYDYQAKIDWSPNQANRLSLLAFGSHDEMKFLLNKPPSGDSSIRGDMSMWVEFHRVYLSWVFAPGKKWQLRTSLVGGWDMVNLGIGEDRYLKISAPSLYSRTDLEWQLSDRLNFKSGLLGGFGVIESSISMPRPPKEGEVPGRFSTMEILVGNEDHTYASGAVYGSLGFKLVDDLLLTAGMRIEAYSKPLEEIALMPRFGLKYKLRPGTVFKAGLGLYYQPAQHDELSNTMGNPDLAMERAWHYTLGFEQDLPASIKLDFQIFYKSLDRLVVADPETMYNNQGIGKISGLEVLIRRDLTDNLFGWLAYTMMLSKRKDGPDEGWRLFDFDQTHILTLVLGYQLPTGEIQPAHGLRDGWEFGVRFQLATGNPDTPIVGGLFDADYDTYHRIPGLPNSERLPYFHQLDIRVDYTWAFTSWALSLYLDVQNVYNHRAIEAVRYNYDNTERAYLEGLPILPYLGIRGSF